MRLANVRQLQVYGSPCPEPQGARPIPVSVDGQRFLMARVSPGSTARVVLVTDFFSELERRFAGLASYA